MTNNPTVLHKLESVPSRRDYHTWADYIELLCLVNYSHELSKADILDRLLDRQDLGEGIEEDEQEDMHTAVRFDKMTSRVDDWFRHLEYREGAFSSFYPFYLSRDHQVLKVRPESTRKHHFYLYLLCSSNLSYFSGSQRSALTRDFEAVSQEALKACLPRNAEVHIFGTSRGANARYQGQLWDRIQKLAEDLATRVIIEQTVFSPHNAGDRGLDIVAWIPLGDRAESTPIWFGQCACTPEWGVKQFSSSPANWSGIIKLPIPPHNIVFIPFCFRDTHGLWYNPSERAETIIIDRLRFIYLLRNRFSIFATMASHEIVESVIAIRESIF